MPLEQGSNMENVVEQLLVQITETLIRMEQRLSNLETGIKTLEGQTRLAVEKLETLEGSTEQFSEFFGDLSAENGGVSPLFSKVSDLMQPSGGRNVADMMRDLTEKMGQINSRLGPKAANQK